MVRADDRKAGAVTAPTGDPPRLRLPDPARTFDGRARRLGALADGHAAGDWLALLAAITRGQHAAVRDVPVPEARAPGAGPPLALLRVPRDSTWQRMLAVLLQTADDPGLPAEARAAIARLTAAEPAALERLAGRLLAGTIGREELAEATFVGAALQAWFGALAGGLGGVEPDATARTCPVCGAQPVAGVIDGSTRLRYLSCSLCGTQWNFSRVTCVGCGGEAALTYFKIEGEAGAEAEACDACHGYLKLFDQEQRPGADAQADDVATLGLDLLLADEGYRRLGASPWLAVAG
jgi:FdhE protein